MESGPASWQTPVFERSDWIEPEVHTVDCIACWMVSKQKPGVPPTANPKIGHVELPNFDPVQPTLSCKQGGASYVNSVGTCSQGYDRKLPGETNTYSNGT